MVTKTIKGSEVKVLIAKISGLEMYEKDIKVAGLFKNDKDLEKALNGTLKTADEKIVAILSVKPFKALCGMPEQVFLEQSKILPPRF